MKTENANKKKILKKKENTPISVKQNRHLNNNEKENFA